jgi:hypothetical protein
VAKINLKTLEMSRCLQCVIGQLTGTWSNVSEFLHEHGLDFDTLPSTYGFTLSTAMTARVGGFFPGDAWNELTVEWKRQIEERLVPEVPIKKVVTSPAELVEA